MHKHSKFDTFGPIEFAGRSTIQGWAVGLSNAVTAVYGSLNLHQRIKQTSAESLSGMVMYIPDSGVSEVRLAGHTQVYRIAPGHCYFYPAQAGQYNLTMQQPGTYSGLKVYFQTPAISELQTSVAKSYRRDLRRPSFAEIPIDQHFFDQVVNLPNTTPASNGQKQVLAQLHKIVELVLQHWQAIELGSQQSEPRDWQTQISAADHYLRNHLEQPPTVLGLANIVGLNHMTMKRGFRRTFGSTVYQRLLRWRMQLAQDLLLNGHSVTDTALSVGYANPSKFAAAFKRYYGFNPSQQCSGNATNGNKQAATS